MNRKNVILAALVVLVLVGGVVLWQHRPVPTTVRLDLTGTAELKVAGTLVVDGVPREFSGKLPTNIAVEAQTFEYTILMQEPRGEMSAKLTTGIGVYSSAGAANDFAGVRGHYSHTWGGHSASANTTNTTRKAQ
jgi:hypothetical protein